MRIWLIWIKRINVTYYDQYFTLNCLLSLEINTRNNKWCKWQISETINHVISSELQHIIRHRKIGYIVWKSAVYMSTYINIVCMIVALLEWRYAMLFKKVIFIFTVRFTVFNTNIRMQKLYASLSFMRRGICNSLKFCIFYKLYTLMTMSTCLLLFLSLIVALTVLIFLHIYIFGHKSLLAQYVVPWYYCISLQSV